MGGRDSGRGLAGLTPAVPGDGARSLCFVHSLALSRWGVTWRQFRGGGPCWGGPASLIPAVAPLPPPRAGKRGRRNSVGSLDSTIEVSGGGCGVPSPPAGCPPLRLPLPVAPAPIPHRPQGPRQASQHALLPAGPPDTPPCPHRIPLSSQHALLLLSRQLHRLLTYRSDPPPHFR